MIRNPANQLKQELGICKCSPDVGFIRVRFIPAEALNNHVSREAVRCHLAESQAGFSCEVATSCSGGPSCVDSSVLCVVITV